MEKRTNGLGALFILPGIFLLATVVFPGIKTIVQSFMHTTIISSGTSNTFVGLENYRSLFMNPQFPSLIGDTLLFSLVPLVLALGLGALAALGVPKIPSAAGRAVVIMLAMLPACLPPALYQTFLPLYTENSVRFRTWGIVFLALRAAGPVILCAAGGAILANEAGYRSWRVRLSGLLAALFIGTAMLMSPADDLLYTANTLFSYMTRAGLMMPNLGQAYAAWTVKLLIQLLPAAGGAMAAFFLLNANRSPIATENIPVSAWPMGQPVPVPNPPLGPPAAKPSLLPFLLVLAAGAVAGIAGIVSGAVTDLTATVITVVPLIVLLLVFALQAVPTAFAAAGFKRPIVPALLILLCLFSQNIVQDYMTIRTLGMVNTVFSYSLLSGINLPLLTVAGYLCYIGGKRAWPYAVAVGGLLTATAAGGFVLPHVFVASRDAMSLSQKAFHSHYAMGRTSDLLPAVLALTLICLGIWLVFSSPLFLAGRMNKPSPAACPPASGPYGYPQPRPMQPPYPPQPPQAPPI